MDQKSTFENKFYSMADYCDIQLRVEPYLKKYLTKTGILRITPDSDHGEEIIRCLRPARRGWRPPEIPENERLILRVPEHYIRSLATGRWLSEKKELRIRRAFMLNMWQELYYHVRRGKLIFGKTEIELIREFRDMHRITEEDFKEESMVKRYRRLKADTKSSIKLQFFT